MWTYPFIVHVFSGGQLQTGMVQEQKGIYLLYPVGREGLSNGHTPHIKGLSIQYFSNGSVA
jgi:hypothetical protein